jgi:hypothetical protein
MQPLAKKVGMTTQRSQAQTHSLYEQDYYLWLETTLEQLRQQDLAHLDWSNLIEEIEALGNEQRRKVESYLKQLLIHLLLYRYWDSERSRCTRGWESEINNFRDELEFLLRSKTLHNYFLKQIDSVYFKARRQVVKKTGLDSETFPDRCPFDSEQILNPDYLPISK